MLCYLYSIDIYNETYHRGYTDDYYLKHINVIFM